MLRQGNYYREIKQFAFNYRGRNCGKQDYLEQQFLFFMPKLFGEEYILELDTKIVNENSKVI